jgi:hypothetical protein
MSFDIVLMAIVVGGIGLSAAYVRAEYILWREHGATERRRDRALRALHTARLSDQQSDALLPSVLQLQSFGEAESANPEGAVSIGPNGAARTVSPRTNSPRTYPLAERRKRRRQRATL